MNCADAPKEYTDFVKPEFKDKIVLTYPNDDDAVLYQFDLMCVLQSTRHALSTLIEISA